MYLLDTDILSNLMKQSPPPNLLKCINSTPVRNQFTSSVNLGELIYGARKRQSSRLWKRIEQQVTNQLQILPFDSEAASRYGEIRSELEYLGTPIGDADTMIAAIALSRRLIIVTGNVRHFSRVPNLTVENWL